MTARPRHQNMLQSGARSKAVPFCSWDSSQGRLNPTIAFGCALFSRSTAQAVLRSHLLPRRLPMWSADESSRQHLHLAHVHGTPVQKPSQAPSIHVLFFPFTKSLQKACSAAICACLSGTPNTSLRLEKSLRYLSCILLRSNLSSKERQGKVPAASWETFSHLVGSWICSQSLVVCHWTQERMRCGQRTSRTGTGLYRLGLFMVAEFGFLLLSSV